MPAPVNIGQCLEDDGAWYVDNTLENFEKHGPPRIAQALQATVENSGARIWYASYGRGTPVILLHGGLGNSRNWGFQIPALLDAGYRVIVIDSRGHGRSVCSDDCFSYSLMATDVLAVMDSLSITSAPIIGWSDGACTGLEIARCVPHRISALFFFACNVNPGGVKPFEMTPVIQRCLNRHRKDYEELAATPHGFHDLSAAVERMQAEHPDYGQQELAGISVPVTVAHGEHDEFIAAEHAEYIAHTLPNGRLVNLRGVSHFAPVQQPALFNSVVLDFLFNTVLRDFLSSFEPLTNAPVR